MERRKCSVCGLDYTPTAYNQTRCHDCAVNRKMVCGVCGAVYTASAHNRPGNRSRCPDCLAKFRGAMNTRAAHVQRDDARAAAFAAKSAAGRENIKKAVFALHTNPRTAAGSHDHAHAKIWLLRDPRGNTVETQNIRAFVADHPDVFPNAKSAIKSFYVMSQTLMHPETVRRPQYSYHGWSLVSVPTTPDDVQARREYRALKEQRREKLRSQEDNKMNQRSSPRRTNASPMAAARLAKGMTQAQLAEAVGVKQQQIARWEAGAVEPRASVLKKIGDALGVECQTLI